MGKPDEVIEIPKEEYLVFHASDNFQKLKSLSKLPSCKDKINFAQFCFVNDQTGMVMYHIPYNYFHVWRDQGVQETLKDISKLITGDTIETMPESLKNVLTYINEKLET